MEQSTPGLRPHIHQSRPPTARDAPTVTPIRTSSFSQTHLPVRDTADPLNSRSPSPSTPTVGTPVSVSRRTSQPHLSPHLPPAHPPKHEPTRRASGSAGLEKPLPAPRLRRKSSRTSFGGDGTADEHEGRSTPKRSISNLIHGLREAQKTMESIEEPVPLTAATVAVSYFAQELARHEDVDTQTETVVILHDACYGHRWSRLRTPKSQLSLIFERPERIQACVLGASTAYVRLGGHHEGAREPPHPDRKSMSKPPFKIRRSARSIELTSSYVTKVHGTAWMSELHGMCDAASERLAAGTPELARSMNPGEPEKGKLHEGDLYLAPGSLDAFQGALGGVADAIDDVFSPTTKTKRAFVAVRPPGHHCSADHPSGFCWLNNVHVGIEYAAQVYGLTHAAILDFDLHHGDGSQAITWERNAENNDKRMNAKPNSKLKLGPDIGYYSLHDINSYPCEMGDDEKVQAASLCIENAHSQSIWNVHLQPWKTEEDFWRLYEERYRVLLDKAKSFLKHHSERIDAEGRVRPKAAFFLSAGFDASEWETPGMQRHHVSVPTEFYARFTEDVVKIAEEIEACGGRVISVLEGGYSDRALCSGILSHLSGLCATRVTEKTSGVGDLMDLSDQMNAMSINGHGDSGTYDKKWWSVANLTALEHKINPPPPPQSKKVRAGPQPTYATPTESFAYKVVDADKFARSISGTMRDPKSQLPGERPPTPAPEVDWVVATQKLSELLIPMDRQTKSCTSEELALPRVKKARDSGAAIVSTREASQPRQLRDRKAKTPAYAGSAHSDETASTRSTSRAESRASRRETIATLPSEVTASSHSARGSRRSSAAELISEINGRAAAADAPPVPMIPQMTSARMKPPPPPASASQFANKKVRLPGSVAQTAASSSAPVSPAHRSTSPSQVEGVPTTEVSKQADVGDLTCKLKKITLKAPPSKEEHDRKQKEKIDAERKARALKGAETRRVNAAAKKAAQAKASSVPPPPTRIPSSSGIPVPSTASRVTPPMDPDTIDLSTRRLSYDPAVHPAHPPAPPPSDTPSRDDPALPPPTAPVPLPHTTTTHPPIPSAPVDEISPLEPAEAPPSEASPPPSSPHHPLATSPAPAPPHRPVLPVFRSTGPIPFASAPPASSAIPSAGEAVDGVVESGGVVDVDLERRGGFDAVGCGGGGGSGGEGGG